MMYSFIIYSELLPKLIQGRANMAKELAVYKSALFKCLPAFGQVCAIILDNNHTYAS